jgi:hypothetical protein
MRTGSSRIGSRPSKCHAIRTLPPRSRTWSGLPLNPPDKALVLCVDETSQIQALGRTRPGWPMTKGRAGTMVHGDRRNGHDFVRGAEHAGREGHRHLYGAPSPSRVPALSQADRSEDPGSSRSPSRGRQLQHPENPGCEALAQSASAFPSAFDAHVSLLAQYGRALFFAEITRRRIRRGAFKSVAELQHAIMVYLDNHNADSKPLVWTKSAGQILEKGRKSKTSVRVTIVAAEAAN